MSNSTEKLLLIFVKNPELGKVKTRLAKHIGDEKALEVYSKLLEHTSTVSSSVSSRKIVYYTGDPILNDHFQQESFDKSIQSDGDLGERMKHAFNENFKRGFKRIVIIGSDCPELEKGDLENAFSALSDHDVVLGPAKDGGYYLLGLKKPFDDLFKDKVWSTSTVLDDTKLDISRAGLTLYLLPEKSDLDTFEDLTKAPLFKNFISTKI